MPEADLDARQQRIYECLKNKAGDGRRRRRTGHVPRFDVPHIDETPKIEVHLVPSHVEAPYGISEPTVLPIVPAVVNAMFAATVSKPRPRSSFLCTVLGAMRLTKPCRVGQPTTRTVIPSDCTKSIAELWQQRQLRQRLHPRRQR